MDLCSVAAYFDCSRPTPVCPVNNARQFRPPGAYQTSNAEDLTAMNFERASCHPLSVAHISNGKDNGLGFARLMRLLIEGRKFAPHHHTDDRVWIDLVAIERTDVFSVSQNRDAIR